MIKKTDTIAAIATPPGRGGVGIIRVSGPKAKTIAEQLATVPAPRVATFTCFKNANNQIIDEGLILFFKGPNSFTGEDVIELQGHGGPVVMDCLLHRVIELGARIARPGEFSERAFLNNKMDLAQAEAVADLINASSVQAAQGAIRSLQGEFSKQINILLNALVELRMLVEAAIDFPEEEIDFLAESDVAERLKKIIQQLKTVFQSAEQGALLREGITAVIAGKPNAGKSSLLNQLSGRDTAIVTEIAGTTRDTLREFIHIDGMPLHIIDTAGLRETKNIIEKMGIERAWEEIKKADIVLLIVDAQDKEDTFHSAEIVMQKLPKTLPLLIIKNKIDLIGEQPSLEESKLFPVISISAKHATGITELKKYLKKMMGYHQTGEGVFIARRRHLDALTRALQSLQNGQMQLIEHNAGELLAEDLRLAQQALGEITGEFTSDDLLGKIFSSFCIGK